MRIALATCERPTERDADFDYLAAALRRRHARAEAPAWTDQSVEWGEFDLVVVSSTWDYHRQPDRFREWLAAVDAATRLRNPRSLIEWNIDKRYLRELADAGIPTVPTVWIEDDRAGVEEAIAERGWEQVVIKPVIDLGAERLARVEPAMVGRILAALDGPAMAQPYLPSVESGGERSLLFVAGSLAHALVKRPARGDFRVQPQYGGTHERIEPDRESVAIAEAAIAAAGGEPLYARVDLLDGPAGPAVIELELIEPYFYLDVAPASTEPLARAILAAAAS